MFDHHKVAIYTPLFQSAGTGCITYKAGLVLTSRREHHDSLLRFYYSQTAEQTLWRFVGFRWGTSLKTTSTTFRAEGCANHNLVLTVSWVSEVEHRDIFKNYIKYKTENLDNNKTYLDNNN